MSNKRIREKLFCFILALIITFCSFCSFDARAEDKKVVRISCGIKKFFYMDEDGNREGYCAEYLRRLEKINNWQFEYVDVGWTEAVDMLEKGEVDILFPTSYLPEREETMDYSELTGGYNISGLFVNDDSDYNYEDYSSFNNVSIAVTKGSSNETLLKEFAEKRGFSYEPVYLNSISEKSEALKNGDVDMAIFSSANDVPDTRLVSILDAEPFYYTVTKGNNELLTELNSGMEKIVMSESDVISDTLSNCMEGANRARLAFTDEERDFIKSGEEIKVGFYKQTEPLAYIDKDGNYNGVYIEILEKAKEISGANISLYPIDRNDNWQDLISNGTIDFYIGASCKLVSTNETFICTDTFMDYETVLITKSNYVLPDNDLKGAKLALTKGRSYWVENNQKEFAGVDIIYCQTAKDCLTAVKSGKADMTLINTIEFNYQSKNSRFSDLIQRENHRFQAGTAIAASHSIDSIKLSVINKAMNSISDEEIETTVNKCLNMPYETMDVIDYIYSSRYILIVIIFAIILLVGVYITVYTMHKKQLDIEKKSQEHEKRQLRIMAALSNDYNSVYYINLDKDTFSIEKTSDSSLSEIALSSDYDLSYSKTMQHYINKFVQPEYRDILLETTQNLSLIEKINKEKTFSIRYTLIPNDENYEYFEMNFSDVSSDDNHHAVVMGIRCIDEIAQEELKRKQVLEDANEKLRRQMGIVGSLSSIYFVTFTGDLVNNIIREVEMPIYARPMIDDSDGKLTDAIDIMVSRFIHTSSVDDVRKFADFSTMSDRIGDRLVISCDYLDIHSSWRRFNIIPMERDENGNVLKAVFTVQIIDEEKKKELETQNALRVAYESANRANHAKSDFLSKMSHDMRTPMNAIIGMTAIAGAHIDDKKRVSDCLSKITSSSKHLLGLINEVLDMNKIESGILSLSEEEFNLPELLNSTLVILQPEIKLHRHKLDVYIQKLTHEDVIGDSLRIQQAIINIMSNSIKYTPDEGNISLTVTERPARESMVGCYEFIFEDNGIGMSEEYINHMFEPFSRAEDVRINKIQGTGLGMTITQNIITMMNGNIRVESKIGKGSRFTVTIFLKILDKDEDISTDEFAGLPVLVADDDIISCESTCEMLNEIGMNSEWVLSGHEAVKRVEETHFENNDFYAVILDWKMPGMDGIETARAIKKIVGEEVPVIILSAYDWSDVEEEARKAGITAFISKPIFKSSLTRLFKNLKKNNNSASENSCISISENNSINVLSEYKFLGKTVLLAEDNELNREIAAELLKMAGLIVEEAENGKEALDMFADSPEGYYSMIFMDIQMPDMNGYDASSAIRALDRKDASEVVIVAMTANAFTEDIQASKRVGMNEHLAKPIDFNAIAAVLRKYLQ